MILFFGAGATVIKQAKKLNLKMQKSVYDLILKNGDEIKGYVGQSGNVFQCFIQHFNPKRGKLIHNVVESGSIIYKMPGSTKLEREMYEQFVILKKYGGQINPVKNPLAKLLNKVNPVGGKFDFKTPKGLDEFREKATEIAKKT
jgi:hypothetical protein